ncbi:cytochrome c biogenesis protein CcsA [Tenacibaculum piscium]|uniref:cytochrome c biogenesis protein CcsA n=1 Tax=Tenacibaculum piscium TaxID=1458515 RepID=UPI001F28B8F1|nr:cytochrome c biogenesis protein CcsA [Tenacibaculum piscium]
MLVLIKKILYSSKLMAILFLLFATAMGIATFIENDYGTQTAKKIIYNAWWFEAIMIFFVINFFGNIFKYRLYKKEKWSVFLFHISFLFILIGAGITRYVSSEGIMPIIEGESSNKMFSDAIYFDVMTDDGKDQKPSKSDKVLLSAIGKPNYIFTDQFRDKKFKFNLVEYIPFAKEVFEENENGDTYIHFVESTSGSRHDHYIKKGTSQLIHNILVGYDNVNNNSIDIIADGDALKLKSVHEGTYLRMADQFTGTIAKDSIQNLQLLSLHQLAGLSFVIPKPAIKGTFTTVTGEREENPIDKLTFDVTVGDETKQLVVNGGQYNIESPAEISVGGLRFRVNYGSKEIELPFYIKLLDFQLTNYPGSQNPISYASEITVIDPKETFDFRIFMNHILNYKGYKFFQSSYNITDEYEETRLSVNHDFWGTTITYIGYAMLFLGMLLSLFIRGTRFSDLRRNLNKIKAKKTVLTIALLLSVSIGFSQHKHQVSEAQIDSILIANQVDPIHAEKFSRIVIQDAGGRMKPVNTFASELLRKVSKKNTYKSLDANQVFLSIQENPKLWFSVPIIYINPINTKLRDIIEIPHDQKYARLADLFTEKGAYKIQDIQEKAFKKKIKSKFEQSVISVSERANLLYSAIGGGIMKIFPVPNDPTYKWVSYPELSQVKFSGKDSVFVKQILPYYFQTLQESKKNNDYTESEKLLEGIEKFQRKFGAEVFPKGNKVDLEIYYNKHDIFKNLFWQYMLAGVFMFIIIIINIFNNSKLVRVLLKVSTMIVVLLFTYHTIGLGIRWYISGHVPWSNGYESMIYIAWATMLFGLIFGRKSTLTIAATAFVTSIILFYAHQNWMDPEIANLVPVLDSYWVLIHVSIIVASYGPLTLSMILGMLALFLMIITTQKNKPKVDLMIKEITIINEMSMNVGLVLLVIGNFLGGMWANESWGRYWGWDPKETWALVSIMLYAFILHTRLIPGLRGRLTFNIFSVFAFASVLMTYLGVNHLLSGLHSYAAGESADVPMQIWTWLGVSVLLSVFAYFKYQKYYKK